MVHVHGKYRTNNALIKVTYFKKRRVMEYKKNQTLQKLNAEGAQVIK